MPTPTRPQRPPAWRILVAGGGPPGLALALALDRALGPAVAVTVFDPAFGTPRPDARAYALSTAASRFLAPFGIWDTILPRVQPIAAMTITDSRLGDVVRPPYLAFAADDEPLGFMVEAEVLSGALLDACRAAGVGLEAGGIADYVATVREVAVTAGGARRTAALLVACDGARSRLREAAGIGWVGHSYRQAGLVATLRHAHDHGGRAVQHFLPAGPFAILPLVGEAGHHRSSVVWTERQDQVARLLALPRENLMAEFETRFGPALGALDLRGEIFAHPLSFGLARSFVAPRLALVGDAAHEIHPLAGQGLNLGLADAAALAERIVSAVRLGLDPGEARVLEAYQRDRRFDAVAMAAATDGLNRLFSNDALPLRVLRDLGLGLVDRAPALKRRFAGEAAGTARRAPALMRGG